MSTSQSPRPRDRGTPRSPRLPGDRPRSAGARRGRRGLVLCAVAAAALLGVGYVVGQARGPHGQAHAAEAVPSPTHRTASPSASPSPAFSPVPTGRFDTARASGTVSGQGTIRRYEVQVEEGTGISPAGAAREVEAVLADPRGWTADGHDAFQLVSGGPHDFEVKIATPATVDRICGAAGLHTHGEVNCDVGAQVMVNLTRWDTGSPEFPGPVGEYRALIINHEVGHRIGHGHEGCPGPGRPAPAMMQQIDGLHGCRANAWPYDSHGAYLGGPPVPDDGQE